MYSTTPRYTVPPQAPSPVPMAPPNPSFFTYHNAATVTNSHSSIHRTDFPVPPGPPRDQRNLYHSFTPYAVRDRYEVQDTSFVPGSSRGPYSPNLPHPQSANLSCIPYESAHLQYPYQVSQHIPFHTSTPQRGHDASLPPLYNGPLDTTLPPATLPQNNAAEMFRVEQMRPPNDQAPIQSPRRPRAARSRKTKTGENTDGVAGSSRRDVRKRFSERAKRLQEDAKKMGDDPSMDPYLLTLIIRPHTLEHWKNSPKFYASPLLKRALDDAGLDIFAMLLKAVRDHWHNMKSNRGGNDNIEPPVYQEHIDATVFN